jgi:hypothetical protein
VRDDDGANITGINAQGLEPRAKLAVGAPESSINKDILIRRVDQENAVVNVYPVKLQIEFESYPLKLCLLGIDHKLTRRMSARSVRDDPAPKVAESEFMGCDRHFISRTYEAPSPKSPPTSGFSWLRPAVRRQSAGLFVRIDHAVSAGAGYHGDWTAN